MLRRTGATGLAHAIDPARIAILVVPAKALGNARILEHLHRRNGSFATRTMAASRVRVSPFVIARFVDLPDLIGYDITAMVY